MVSEVDMRRAPLKQRRHRESDIWLLFSYNQQASKQWRNMLDLGPTFTFIITHSCSQKVQLQ